MNMTRHARARWIERFPTLDPQVEWQQAGRVGRRLRARIRSQCPAHAHLASGLFKGFYYRLSRAGVVFVVAAPDTIVTVFRLDRSPAKQ